MPFSLILEKRPVEDFSKMLARIEKMRMPKKHMVLMIAGDMC